MGKFDKFKGKGKSKQGDIVRINKYDSKAAVLDLISYIATADDDFEIMPYFSSIIKVVNEFVNKEKAKSGDDSIDSALKELNENISNIIKILIEKLESNHGIGKITIAVGGGYSSGKSSFLNKVTGLGNLLPTGVEPVSIVNTLLTFSQKNKNLIIRGKNFKDSYVRLNRDVLESIQHASKSKVYVASVLDNILIDIPCSEGYINNITLVDTPGYNNSTFKNYENAKSDKDTALEALKKSDAFIWCIDSEAGTIPTKDIEIIKEILENRKDVPYLIMFTKRDKKDIGDQKRIIKEAYKLSQKSLPIPPYSILGFSDREENPYLISNGKNIESFFTYLKKRLPDIGIKKNLWKNIETVVNTCEEQLVSLSEEFENERVKLSQKKSYLRSKKNDVYDQEKSNKELLEEIILDDYNGLLDNIEEHRSLISTLFKELNNGFEREREWLNKSGFFSDTSSLTNKLNNAISRYNNFELPDEYPTYDEDFRQEIVNFFQNRCDDEVEDVNEDLNEINEHYKKILEGKKQIQKCIKALNELKNKLYHLVDMSFNRFLEDITKHYDGKELKNEEYTDIFSAIAADNTKSFTTCLSREQGVDFSICNKSGYNPLTFAVHCGNTEMIKYLIDHDVDLSMKDDRGYSAFETAVIEHYRDICELILKKDPSAKFTDEPLEELYEKNTFKNWITQI